MSIADNVDATARLLCEWCEDVTGSTPFSEEEKAKALAELYEELDRKEAIERASHAE